MTENNDTLTTASQETAERALNDDCPGSQTSAIVTLEAIAVGEGGAEIIRQVLPSADVRVELVGRRLNDGGTWVDMVEPVSRCTYSSVPQALDATRLFHFTKVRTHVDVTTVLDQEELVVLACYHIDSYLGQYPFLQWLRHQMPDLRGTEPAPGPLSYDQLPWPDQSLGPLSDYHRTWYHLRHLAKLESILGMERVRRIYDWMVEHPHPREMSDFFLARLHVDPNSEAWRTYAYLAPRDRRSGV